ncbi:lanthionine synthetase LanC family protein [Segatella copri]|uniref:lanthionine synthetase LanC family protein n=1 Tax=Segatella copri TaxID=165179 RepID=UPI00346117EF
MYLNKNSLYTLPNDIVVDDWIPVESKGATIIAEKLSALSSKVQEEQLCMIDESVNFFLDVIGVSDTNKKRILPVGKDSIDRNVLWQAIERIEKEIRKRMIQIDNEIGFVCRTRNVYDGKFQVCLMNDSLYDGLLGVCLFYLTLFTYSHEQQHEKIALGIFRQLCENRDVAHIGVKKNEIAISPLSGIMGLLYIMETFPKLYNTSIYQSIVKEVKELIPITTQFDYMSGLAGVILFTTQCKLMKETDKLIILKASGERLLQLAKNINGKMYWTYTDGNKIVGEKELNLGGFAHGSSSMATAMFLLYKQFGEIRYLEAFKHSLLHDRSFYSDKIQGWIDGRNTSYEEDCGSWCHGATGIALSRLILASEGFSDKIMMKELNVAIKQVEKRIGYNLSVCHGSMGNLEILHLLSMRNDTKALKWVNSIAIEISKGQDVICGDDNRNSQVGLFMGFAGIGYQLLKFYDWNKVPSILCLEISRSTLLH